MGSYTIVADVGKTLVELLRDQMCPEPVNKPEMIGICDPNERGSCIVGIHSYDFREGEGTKSKELITLPDGSKKDPPTTYEASYVISIVSKAEPEGRAMDEQRIYGRLLQVMTDYKIIPRKYMPKDLKQSDDEIKLTPVKLELDEKVKIWTMLGSSYKLSAFYTIGPIIVESAVIRKPPKRVASLSINSDIKK